MSRGESSKDWCGFPSEAFQLPDHQDGAETMRDPLMLATGKALALLVAALQRDGALDGQDFGRLMALFATLDADAEAEQGHILAVWASMIEGG